MPAKGRISDRPCPYYYHILSTASFSKFTTKKQLQTMLRHKYLTCMFPKFMFTEILEVNLFAFAYRLFHEDFSPLDNALKVNVLHIHVIPNAVSKGRLWKEHCCILPLLNPFSVCHEIKYV